MKNIVVLVFVFGCVAVIYALHWASAIFKETGSVSETARRLYAHETTPDAIRMSLPQREYVAKNLGEFMDIHRDLIETEAAKIMADLQQAGEANAMGAAEIGKMVQSVLTTVAMRYAKSWCELRGIA
jgi:hypothetical protein